MLRGGLLPCILHTLLRRGLLRYRLHTCPKLWCNPCSKCYGMGCLAAYFTHVQSCDVTRVQSATQWTASVQTSHQDVMQYRGRFFTGRHVTSGRHMQELPWTRSVTSRHVRTLEAWTRRPSRHVTSGRHRRRRGQGGHHVTSEHHRRRRGQGCRHVTSRHVRKWGAVVDAHRRGQGGRHVTSRHVMSRHDVRRPQSGPFSFVVISSLLWDHQSLCNLPRLLLMLFKKGSCFTVLWALRCSGISPWRYQKTTRFTWLLASGRAPERKIDMRIL